MDISKIQSQIDTNRRSVAFDSYDFSVRQLAEMVIEETIDIAPEYQRHFAWSDVRQSQLIESLILGIPVPSLFMATNKDSTWEVIDGLQRLTTLINFISNDNIIKKVNPSCKKLKIAGLEKLDSINGLHFEELPKSTQLMFMTRPLRVTVLNDKSDLNLRYDLFERLNTGGIILHPQEIRNCIYLGKFKDFLLKCSLNEHFKKVVKVPENSSQSGITEELVLKFFAYYENRELFIHSVKGFLNDYMASKSKYFKEKDTYEKLFEQTFMLIAESLPDGIVRSNRKNTTPLILFEAIAIGVADLIHEKSKHRINYSKLQALLDDEELKKLTTGATNSRLKLIQRIEYVKNGIIS